MTGRVALQCSWPVGGRVEQYALGAIRARRRPSIFSLAESAPPPNVRDALFSLLQGADPLDPKAPQGPHPHPNPPRDPTARGGRGPRGTQGAFGALGGDGPMGPFGVIPQPFRMASHFEWMAFSNGKPSRLQGHSEWKALPDEKLMKSCIISGSIPQ